MPIITFSADPMFAGLGAGRPVPQPLGKPVSCVSSASLVDAGAARAGVWRCTPGRWVRQVEQAEFCHFLEGEAIFHPADGSPDVHLKAGDCAWFPSRSRGSWTILAESRKVFVLIEGEAAA